MIPDRTTLVLACAIATVPYLSMPAFFQQLLGIAYAVHALAGHRRDLRLVCQPRRP
jgi:hypothetical protein